jgi:hypothetical protein
VRRRLFTFFSALSLLLCVAVWMLLPKLWSESPMTRRMNPDRLPDAYRPFLPLFEKWGDVRSDSTRYELLDRAMDDPAEMRELQDWHEKLSKADLTGTGEWMDGPISPLNENYERAKVYFTFLLMYGELDINGGKQPTE